MEIDDIPPTVIRRLLRVARLLKMVSPIHGNYTLSKAQVVSAQALDTYERAAARKLRETRETRRRVRRTAAILRGARAQDPAYAKRIRDA